MSHYSAGDTLMVSELASTVHHGEEARSFVDAAGHTEFTAHKKNEMYVYLNDYRTPLPQSVSEFIL